MNSFCRVACFVVVLAMLAVQGAVRAQTPALGFVDESVIGTLTAPTGFAWLPDGRILIAQKNGLVRLVKNGVLQTAPFIDLRTRVNDYWDRGLLSIAAHPNFASNGFVYFYYVYEHNAADYSGPKTVRLTRATAVGDAASLASETVILGTLSGPSCGGFAAGSDCIPADSPSHNGGTIRFASDNTIYLTTGDASSFNVVDPLALRVQDVNSLAGKILHVTSTGAGLSTNPFYNGNTSAARSKVWAFGLRNPFRMSLKPGTNQPYVGDVGWASWEEINIGRPGVNLGWPCYEGGQQQPGYANYTLCQTLYAQGTAAVQMPLVTWDHNGVGAAVLGGVHYTGTAFPATYQGAYFFGDYARGTFSYLRTDANDVLTSGPTSFASGVPGPVDLHVGTDGNLYYLAINTGELRRIRYTGGSGGTSYISSLSWTSATNGWGPVERDESNGEQAAGDGNALTLNGQTYARGLGVHAPSDVRFQLGGQCTAFQSSVGVDDEVGANGSVIFQVWADGVKLYDSGVMTGSTATRTATANLTGRQELALIVTNGGDNSNFDHADWADATITCNSSSGGIQLASAVSLPALTNTHGVTFGDLNNDGRRDVIAANSGSNMVSRWLGNVDGTFGTRADFAVGLAPKSVSAADLNADGRLDLVTSNQDASTVSVLIGNGTGGFAAAVHYPAAPNSHENAIADFNGDGRPDLIVVGWGGPVASILLGTGTGTFGARTNFTVGARPHSVVARDFNGDGRMDAAVANIDSNNVSVLIGTGTGTFNPHVTYAVGSGPHSIRSADIDGDGRFDIASANQASNSVSVLRGRADGTFDPAVHHPMGNFPKGVNLGDIDGDGRVDLLTANTAGNYPVCCNPGGDTITIRRGLGSGTFAAAETFTVGLTPFAVTPADLDADGDLDILTANWHGNNVSVLRNVGGGGTPSDPPVITSVSATNITTTTATINWTTDVPSDTQVEYGPTTAYGTLTPLQSTPVTSHQVGLTGLTAGTQYHYRVRSRDAEGELSVSGNYMFTTTTSGGGGSVQYLSDLTWTSMTNGWGPAERDRSNGENGATDGLPIRLNGITYAKGLGVHAASEIRYAIPAGCTQFAADIGVDDEVGSNGSLTFRVQGGTTQLYQSPTLTGTSATVGVTAGLSGHSELRLIVADGGNGIGFDHGDWANARFLCSAPSSPPVISGVSATNITTATATINWTTDVAADTQVEYGTTTAYGTLTPLQATLVTSHQVGLTGLTAGTLYHYRVRSRDVDGELSISGNFTFTTTTSGGGGGVQYLSDLTWTSMTNGWGSAERDLSNGEAGTGDGTTLRLNGTAYTKGLGVHAASEIRYAIPAGCTQFAADIGVDDEVGTNGSVVFRVLGGTTQLYQSATLTGTSATVPVTVGLSGYSELRLLVADGGNGITLDHADWANARFLCGTPSGPPVISGVSATNLTTTAATINWTTNVPADTQVEYGTTTAYGTLTPLQTALTTTHQVGLTGLTAGTLYHYRVRSRDAESELAISGDFTFTTTTSGGGGNVQYLSDLTWTSMTNGWGPAERDRSNGEQGAADGNPIRLGGVTYAKGLGVHAASEIRYAIPAGCTQFAADIGVDDESGSSGSVIFRVLGGTTQLYQSATLTGASATVPVTVGLAGYSELRLIVTDGGNGVDFDHGDWANARFLCVSGNTPPVPTISGPSSTLTYKVGDVIDYSGSATDAEDGAIPASGLSWAIVIHHCPGGACHFHQLTTSTGPSGKFEVPDHGDDSYFELVLTAEDSASATANTSVSIQPQTVQITLNTSPTGLSVVYGGVSGTAPMTRTSVVGSMQTISTPSPQGGRTFVSWSDGGAQQHNIMVGQTNATYTATFTGGQAGILTEPGPALVPTVDATGQAVQLQAGTTSTTTDIPTRAVELASRPIRQERAISYERATSIPLNLVSRALPATTYRYRVRRKDAAGSRRSRSARFRTKQP